MGGRGGGTEDGGAGIIIGCTFNKGPEELPPPAPFAFVALLLGVPLLGFVGVEFALDAVAGDGSMPGGVLCVPVPVLLVEVAVPFVLVCAKLRMSSPISRSICGRTQK